jgi:hypothetical protein
MAEQTSPGVKVKLPTPLLLKPLKVKDWPGLFQSLAKLGSNVAKMNVQAAFSDAVKALSYVEFKNQPQELAWTLIHRSMTRTVGDALARLARHQPAEFTRLGGLADSRRLDAELDTLDVTLDEAFFDRPGWCPYVRQVCRRVPGWLVAAGLPQMVADELARQIPVEFTVRLNEESDSGLGQGGHRTEAFQDGD